jgi:hypothetical protein
VNSPILHTQVILSLQAPVRLESTPRVTQGEGQAHRGHDHLWRENRLTSIASVLPIHRRQVVRAKAAALPTTSPIWIIRPNASSFTSKTKHVLFGLSRTTAPASVRRQAAQESEPSLAGAASCSTKKVRQLKSSARCAGTASFGYWCGMFRHSPLLGQRASQEHLHLGVDASELVVGPTDERVVDGGIEAKQDLPAPTHVYSEPAFTTGDGG